jgi:DNA-binding SARP family transcriptional activator/predicted ATPase
MTGLTIQVLGGFKIQHVGSGTPDLPTRKARAILAYLALSPGMLRSREHLAATFWDRSAEEQARASLRQTLASLRKTLTARTLINADSESVWLDAQAVDVDALRFEQLASERSIESLDQATTVYQGELLGGFSLREEPFEQWMSSERRRLHEVAVQVFTDLADRYAGAEKLDRAIAVTERLLALDPLLESAHRSLMRLYLRTGRREAALRQFRECTRLLSEQLGVAPSEETRRIAADAGREASAYAAPQSPTVRSLGQRQSDPPGMQSVDRKSAVAADLPAERKQLTVLCARIREATGNLDPEAALERDPLLSAMITAVQDYDGTVSQVRGDGVIALFGAPVAHEDHAVRACYAALAIRESIASRALPSLDVRVGIHSGEAVVRGIGNDTARHYDAIGPVSDLADHIDATLAPGEIGLTAATARRAEGFVELSPLKAKRLESAGEIELFALRARSSLRLRWDARSARELTRFVGRETEIAHLVERLERCRRGSGRVVAIVGDPGVGKSRLVHEFITSSHTASWTVLETGTTSLDKDATYLPVANLLRTWFRIGARDTQAEVAAKLRSGVAAVDEALIPHLPPLAAMLDLAPEDTRWSALNPQQQREHTLEAATTLVMRESQKRPMVLVFEDLHWGDAGTQAVLDHLVDRLAGYRVLLVVTYRPEYQHRWSARSYFSQLRVDPLATENADRLLRALLGEDRELVELRNQLIERTGGTPLFLEESVHALAEAHVLAGDPGAYHAARPIEISLIPSTVHAVIAARIDRLPARQKALLQTAAVIGNDVPVELLQPIAGEETEALTELLADLQASEFLYQSRLLPTSVYTFKHALTHQVAYESLLKERRRALHLRLLDLSEQLYTERADEHAERLAHHAVAGEQWSKAVHYLYRSADKAMQRSAHQQALQSLNRGLAIIETLPESPQRLKQELDYRKAIGVTMMAAKGWAATEVLEAYTRARALSEELGDRRELFIALRGEGQYRMIRGESRIARALGERCEELAARTKDVGAHLETHHLFWTNSFFMGDYANADFHCTKGISLYEKDRDHRLTYVYSGHDPGVCCRCFSALVQCVCGQPDRSLEVCGHALRLAEELDHPLTTALAYWAYSLAHILRHEPAAARTWAEREIAVSEEYRLPLLLSQGSFQLGWATAELGDLDRGIERMRDGLAALSATGAEMGLPYYLALLGETLAKAGRLEAGLQEIDRALAIANQRGGNFQISEILRLKGELLCMLSRSGFREAKACYRQAMATAEKQGAKLGKLRAATSLARLLASTGAQDDALALLRPPYEAITEGLQLVDLTSAAALLGELRGR